MDEGAADRAATEGDKRRRVSNPTRQRSNKGVTTVAVEVEDAVRAYEGALTRVGREREVCQQPSR